VLPFTVDSPRLEISADHTGEDLLEAVYFDTGTFALAASGITLRRRTGGTDEGCRRAGP